MLRGTRSRKLLWRDNLIDLSRASRLQEKGSCGGGGSCPDLSLLIELLRKWLQEEEQQEYEENNVVAAEKKTAQPRFPCWTRRKKLHWLDVCIDLGGGGGGTCCDLISAYLLRK